MLLSCLPDDSLSAIRTHLFGETSVPAATIEVEVPDLLHAVGCEVAILVELVVARTQRLLPERSLTTVICWQQQVCDRVAVVEIERSLVPTTVALPGTLLTTTTHVHAACFGSADFSVSQFSSYANSRSAGCGSVKPLHRFVRHQDAFPMIIWKMVNSCAKCRIQTFSCSALRH